MGKQQPFIFHFYHGLRLLYHLPIVGKLFGNPEQLKIGNSDLSFIGSSHFPYLLRFLFFCNNCEKI